MKTRKPYIRIGLKNKDVLELGSICLGQNCKEAFQQLKMVIDNGINFRSGDVWIDTAQIAYILYNKN